MLENPNQKAWSRYAFSQKATRQIYTGRYQMPSQRIRANGEDTTIAAQVEPTRQEHLTDKRDAAQTKSS